MTKNCLTILKNTSPELHDYLRGKAAMDYDESPASKQAYIQAARELQNETLNNLQNIYADLKIGDYKKIATQEPEKVPEPPVSSVDALKDAESTTKALEEVERIKNPDGSLETEDIFKNKKTKLDRPLMFTGKSLNVKPSIESVALKDIIPTQSTISSGNTKAYIKGEKKNINNDAELAKIDGKYYVIDGHHRIASEILKGIDRSDIPVKDYDKALSVGQISKTEHSELVKAVEEGGEVGTEMRGYKFPTEDEVYDLIESEHGRQGGEFIGENGAFENEGKARAYAKEVEDHLGAIADQENIPVYRVVQANEVDLDPYGIGESWSFDLSAAKQFAKQNLSGSSKDWKIISAIVPKENVNWKDAVRQYSNFSDIMSADSEFELPIEPNSKLLNVSVSDYKSAKEQSQPKGVSPSSKGSVDGGEVKVNDFEKEEMLSMIDNRKDTVSEDIESASGIEAEEGALDKLKTKLESGDNNFTKGELQWLKEEADDFLSKAEASFDADGNPQAKKDIPKIKKFISKIDQAIQSLPKGEAAKQPAKPKIRVSAEQVEQGQPKKSEPVKKLSASLSERLSSIQPKVQKNETKEKPNPDNAAQRPASTKAATGSEVSSQTPAQKTRARTKGTRKANRKIKSPVYKKALEVEANRPHDMVMQYFIGGGNIHPSALQEIFGAKGKGKNISKTNQSYIGLLNKDASTIKELVHSFWEDLPEDSPYTDRDFVNAINEVLGSFNSRTQMAEDINKRYNQTLNEEEKTYEQFLEQQRGPIPEEIVQEAVAIVEEMSADEINSLLQADADQQAGIIDEQSEGFTISEADISKSAQAENRLKQAKSNYDKAAKQLNAAEEKISNKQTTQGSLLRSEGAQGQMFGLDRDEAKSILDPLRQKVRETKAELDAAQKEFIAATDQQLNLFDISNSSLQAGDTKNIGDYVTAAKSVLENLYPNAKLEVYNTTEEYEKAGGPKATRGFAIMGKEGKHRILLNLERISEDKSGKTAIHEVIHPIVYDAFGIDSKRLDEAWKDMSVVMKDVPGMELVFAHVRNYAASKAAPEGITELLTQIVTGNINIDNVPKEKKSKILEILNKILEFLGIDFRFGSAQDFAALAQKIKESFDTSNPESLREVIKQKGIDKFIQEYERLSEKDISPQSRDEILNDFVKEQIAAGESLDDIKEALVDNGLSEQEAQKIIDSNTRPRIKVSVGGREGTKSDNKAIVNRMVNSNDISDEVKDILRANDLKYKVKSQKEARIIANAVINEFGIDDSVLLAEAGKFHGDVNSMIFALSLDKVYDIELSAKTPDEKQEAAEKYADIAMRYQDVAESGGRFISAIYDFYKKSPAGLVIKAQKEFQRRQDEYFEGREKPTKEAWQEFINTVEGKELLQEELGKISPKKKKIFTPDTEAKIKSFFSKLKINTKGQSGSYLIPPQIYNAAIDIIEGAVLTGVSIGKAIEQAVQYIGDNYKDTWRVKEFKKDIRDGFKKQNIQRTLSAEDREKILNKWSKKLIGLNQEQKNALLNKAFLELVDNGALEYDQFKQLYAEAIGLPQMTPELAAQLKDLAVKLNEPSKLKDEILKTGSPELISKYKDAVRDAEIAATKLNDLIGKQKWWLNTFLTVMRLNTLGAASLVGNIAYNVAALPVRFAVNLTATGLDYTLSGVQLASDKLFGTSLYTKPPTHNVFKIQGGFARGLALGTSTSIKQFFTGLSNRDYFQKEIKQNIKPLTSAKKFIRGMTGKQKLTLSEKLNSFIEAFPTMGMSAEVIARALNIGDKGFRFAAEFAKAEQLAQQKGLSGTAKEIFILFPDEESEQKIREAGEKIVFQQKNVVTKALDSAGTAISSAIKSKGGEVRLLHGIAKTLGYASQPFLNTPLNVFNEFIHYAFPPLPLYRAGKAMVQGDSEKSIYHLSQAVVGLSMGYAATQLIAQGLIIGSGDDDEEKKRKGIQSYQRQGQINKSGVKRLLAGNYTGPEDGDIWIDLKYYGFIGMILLMKAEQHKEKTKEEIEGETYLQDVVGQFVPAVKIGLTEGVFSGTSSLINAISMGGRYTDNWLLGMGNVFFNAFEPNWLRSLSMANNDYIRDTRGMSLGQEAKNQLKNRLFSGGGLPSKIDIWGEKIESVPAGADKYLYNIIGLNKKNVLDNDQFGYALYDYYNQTKNYNIFPPVLKREVNQKPLTPEQYEQFQILVGSHRKQLVNPLIQSGEFEILKADGVDGVVKKLGSIYGESRRLGVREFEKLYPEFQIKKKKQEGQEDEIIEGEVEQ